MSKCQRSIESSPARSLGAQNRRSLPESASLWLMLLVVLFCLVHLWASGQRGVGLDFYQFWAVGQALLSMEVDDIYSDEGRTKIGAEIARRGLGDPAATRHHRAAKQRQVLETYSTPFLYTVLSFFRAVRYEIAYQTYLLFCLLCSISAIMVLCRLLGYSTLATMAAITVLTFWFEPFVFDLDVANVTQIQLAQLALFAWVQSRQTWRHRDFASGFVLGLMVMFKPNTIFVGALLLLSWLVSRFFRQLAWAVLGFAASAALAVGLSALFFGSPRCWLDWVHALRSLPDDIITVPMGNFALMRLLTDKWDLSSSLILTVFLFALTTVFVWLSRSRGLCRGDEGGRARAWHMDMQMVGLGCLLYLLPARLAWLYYYLLTVPMILVTLRTSFVQTSSSLAGRLVHHVLTMAAVVLLAARPIMPLLGAQQAYPYLICAGALLLFGLGLTDLWRMRKLDF